MFFNERYRLTIIEKTVEIESVALEELAPLLWKYPSIVVYIEVNNRLFGVISMGDIERAWVQQQDRVRINTNFTKVGEEGYLTARTIFKEKESINAIPIVSKEGSLLGDYTRWNDALMFGRPFTFVGNELVKRWHKRNRKIYLVEPAKYLPSWTNGDNEIKLILGGGYRRFIDN